MNIRINSFSGLINTGTIKSECSKCKYENPTPVAVMVASLRQNKIVFIKRRNNPEKGSYALPGGYVNKMEHPKDAAIRELKEETGIEVVNKSLVRLLSVLVSPRNHLVFVYYSPFFNNSGLHLEPGDDAEEILFKDLRDNEFISSIPFQTHREGLSVLQLEGGEPSNINFQVRWL